MSSTSLGLLGPLPTLDSTYGDVLMGTFFGLMCVASYLLCPVKLTAIIQFIPIGYSSNIQIQSPRLRRLHLHKVICELLLLYREACSLTPLCMCQVAFIMCV